MNATPMTRIEARAAERRSEDRSLTVSRLRDENRRFRGSGGVSRENRSLGLLPAFLDARTGAVYLSRFRDGRVAPVHLLDGLPPGLASQPSMIAGFVHGGHFLTREQAAALARPH